MRCCRRASDVPSPRLFWHTLKFLNLSIDSTIKEPLFSPSPPLTTPLTMPAPTNTLLIEGSFSELAEEFAQYIDTLRKEGNLQSEIAPLIQPIREQEQSEGEPDLKQRDEVLKKLVGAAAVLNGAPEKGEWEILEIAADKEKSISRRTFSALPLFVDSETDLMNA